METINYGELNEVQLQAVQHETGPMMVIAGPGSGKTRVLTYRIAHLLSQGVAPWNIMALTFTNKAAREMKERIVELTGDHARNLWMGTFHSIFAKILRIESDKIGFNSNFTIYDTQDSKSLLTQIIKDLGLDKKAYNVGGIKARISSAKCNIVSAKDYASQDDLMKQDIQTKRPYFYKIYSEYEKRLNRSSVMDFDDLLYRLYLLLMDNPQNIKEKYRNKFPVVMVDEFQDTNYLQYSIIKELTLYDGSQEDICVVGDDAQSIYAFRGATIDNIFDFQRDYENVQMYKLEQNYRSTPHIIKAANGLITYNKKQIKKTIWTDEVDGERVQIIKAMTDNDEGKRVADLIMEHKNRYHLANSQMAILYRTNAQSRIFEEHLRRANIPYRVFGGLSFYQRKEIKDVIAYMRLALNTNDDEAFKRAINYPKRGIGKTSLDKILQLSHAEGISIWEAMGKIKWSNRMAQALADFKKTMASMRKKALEADAYVAAVHIAKTSGLYGELSSDRSIEGMNRLANVTALLDGIKEFVDSDEVTEENQNEEFDKTLSTYIQNISLLTDMDMDTDTDQKSFVSLMSGHSAKGLEFEAIFVVGLEENLFPSFMAFEEPNGIDEERRLFYVAITRAKRFLTLTYAASRYLHGQLRYNDVSRFLEEIPQEHVNGLSLAGFSDSSGSGSSRSGVVGLFKPPISRKTMPTKVYENFEASDTSLLETGMKVLHLKFGPGEVVNMEGGIDNKIATIHFDDVSDNPERRIMLKFAKLQILN